MKELKRPIHKGLPLIRMYLEDVQAIYNILRNNCSSVIIKTEKYEISDVTKLKDIGENQIHTLRFECQDPYVSINFLPFEGRLYISEDSTITRGILSQIEDILNKCKRKIMRLLCSSLMPTIMGVLVGAAFYPILRFTEGGLSVTLLVFLVLIYILLLVIFYRISLHQYSTIILSERRERTSFLKRNKDQIIVGLIVAIVSVCLTVLAFKLFQ
jgi:hypothetical protein